MTANNLQIILVRHGQTDSNKQHILQGQIDTPLNDTGRLQARAAGKRLATEQTQLDAVWSSDLIRCRETTKLILSEADQSNHLEVVYQSELRERDMGELEGMKISDARIKSINEGKTFHQYGEPKQVSVHRLNKAFDKIVDECISNEYKSVMIVSHGGMYLPPAPGRCPDPLFLASRGYLTDGLGVIAGFCNHIIREEGYTFSDNVTADDIKVPHNVSFTLLNINTNTKTGVIETFGDKSHLTGELRTIVNQKAL